MCSSGTSSPSTELTFLYLMRAIVRSSSWLNETPCLRTAWKSLIGIATNPKLIVPFQTGRGISQSCPIRGAAHTHESTRTFQWAPDRNRRLPSSPAPLRFDARPPGREHAAPTLRIATDASRARRLRCASTFARLAPSTTVKRSAGEHGAGDEIGAERGEDGQVEQTCGGHHGRVLALLERRPRDDDEHDRRDLASTPETSHGADPCIIRSARR